MVVNSFDKFYVSKDGEMTHFVDESVNSDLRFYLDMRDKEEKSMPKPEMEAKKDSKRKKQTDGQIQRNRKTNSNSSREIQTSKGKGKNERIQSPKNRIEKEDLMEH